MQGLMLHIEPDHLNGRVPGLYGYVRKDFCLLRIFLVFISMIVMVDNQVLGRTIHDGHNSV